MSGPLRIGTRSSPLALAQAQEVADALAADGHACELVPLSTRGDRETDRPLAEIGGKGLFVEEIERALRTDDVDLAVHSAKDLPSDLPADTEIRYVLDRADPRDVLVGLRLGDLVAGTRIGTSGPRRAALLRVLVPGVAIVPVRGNVGTRLGRLDAREMDGLVLAAAGLARLGVERAGEWLDPATFVPAAGQGMLAVESRAGDRRVGAIVERLVGAAAPAVALERRFVAACHGDCSSAIGAHATITGDRFELRAAVGFDDGTVRVESVHGAVADAADVIDAAVRVILAR